MEPAESRALPVDGLPADLPVPADGAVGVPVGAGQAIANAFPGGARRAVAALAWPMVTEYLLQTLLQMVDTALVGRLGATAVAAVGGASQYIWFIISAASALTIGTTVLVAHATGARNPSLGASATRQSLLLAVVLSGVLGVAGELGGEIAIAALGAEPEVVRLGAGYLRVSLWLSLGLIGHLVCSAAFRGAGDSRTPMLVGTGVNALNLALAYPLIFGLGPVPAFGVLGSAWATGAARIVGAVILLGLLFRSGRLFTQSGRSWRPNLQLVRRLLRVGLPASGEQVLFSGGFLLYTAMAVGLGTIVFAAQRITFVALALSFMIGMGFSLAISTLVGQAIGAGRPDQARQVTAQGVLINTLAMGAVSVVLFLFPETVMRVFTPDEAVVEAGVFALQVIAVSQPIGAPGLIWAGALRGAGDTRWVMWSSGVGMWVIRLPVAYVCGYALGLGLPGIYLGNSADLAVRSVWSWWRFRSGHWERIKV